MSSIAVALSGGVDSSVTAALLKQEGHNIFGVTMRLCDTVGAEKAVIDAKRLCDQLKINHHVIDLRSQFQSIVIDYFKSCYINGLTPNPCAKCNQRIKFGILFDTIAKMGAEILATGHYARIMKDEDGEFGVYKGVDERKDQSYFLFGIEKNLLKSIRFPLGDKCKSDVRKLAAELDLCNALRKESQDICFIPNGDYKSALSCQPVEGEIVDINGKILGRHKGLWNYTIGQRKGLGISDNQPLFVIEMDSETNQLIVGNCEDLEYQEFCVADTNWQVDQKFSPEKVMVKTRYAQAPVPAQIEPVGTSTFVKLLSPSFALSPGQCAVFYQNERVLGGGWIQGQGNKKSLNDLYNSN